MRRERMSRPNSSVPQGCASEGDDKRVASSMRAGSWGAIQGANSANITKMTTSTTPTMASQLCWAERAGAGATTVVTWATVAISQKSLTQRALGIKREKPITREFEITVINLPHKPVFPSYFLRALCVEVFALRFHCRIRGFTTE